MYVSWPVCAGQAGGLTFTGVSLLDNSTMRVGAFQGPGVTGTNLWLLPDPEATRMPGYSWPAELFANAAHSDSGSSHGAPNSVALRAGIGVAAGVLGLLAVGLLVVGLRMRHRCAGRSIAVAEGSGGKGAQDGGAAGDQQHIKPSSGQQLGGTKRHAAEVDAGTADADVVQGDKDGAVVKAAVAAGAGAAAAAALKSSSKRQPSGEGSPARAAGVCSPGDAANAGQKPSANDVQQTIADGLERWNTAVSMTTMQIMQRRLQNTNLLYGCQGKSSSGSGSASRPLLEGQQDPGAPDPLPLTATGPEGGTAGETLQLQSVIGTGSFGSVYLSNWRGKRVAVKVMHLQSNALIDGEGASGRHSQDYTEEQQRERIQRQRAQNSPPHMAIMEAVVSSTMSHPNVSGDAVAAGMHSRCFLTHRAVYTSKLCDSLQASSGKWFGEADGSCGHHSLFASTPVVVWRVVSMDSAELYTVFQQPGTLLLWSNNSNTNPAVSCLL